MRITYLNPVGMIGGAERVLLTAVRSVRTRLPQASISVVLFSEGPLRGALDVLGATTVVIPLPPALAGVGDSQLRGGSRLIPAVQTLGRIAGAAPEIVDFFRRLRHTLRTLRPDLIHSNGLKTHAIAFAARPPNVPVIWHIHDFLSHRPIMARVLSKLRRGVRAGIAISSAVQRDATGVLPGLTIPVVANAVDTEHFSPGPGDGAELDRLAGMSSALPGTICVGLVATYANWKGHDVFLDALAQVPNVRGYIIGGPIYTTAGSQFTREELERRAIANGVSERLGFIPFQPDPLLVYRSLDVVVHASTRAEPFGLTIAEAMSCGRAVVVSAAGGASDLFTEGLDGLGHPPGDIDRLVHAIAHLATDSDLRFRLGRTARVTALQRFGLARYADKLIAVYQELLR